MQPDAHGNNDPKPQVKNIITQRFSENSTFGSWTSDIDSNQAIASNPASDVPVTILRWNLFHSTQRWSRFDYPSGSVPW